MNNKILKVLLLLSIFFICSCINDKGNPVPDFVKHQDSFYTVSSDFDLIRFPLIKPYEVASIDDGSQWSIRSNVEPKNIKEINDINSIAGLAHIKDCFLVHSKGSTVIQGQEVNEAWYVIIPRDTVTKSFMKETDFYEYIKKEGVKSFKWESPLSLFKNLMKLIVCLG